MKQKDIEVTYNLKDLYTTEDILKMPRFVQEQADEVLVTGKMKKTLILPDGSRYFLGNKLNDLTGREWTFFTNSVINTNYSTNGKDNCAFKFRKIHPSPKPPLLTKSIIEFFTKEGQMVLDYYMGVGGTLLGASMCNRKAIGIELNETYVEAYKNASKYMGFEPQTTFVGDSEELLKSQQVKEALSDKVNLILIDPPYSNMMAREKTGEDMRRHGAEATPFTTSEKDIGNMEEDDFWKHLIATTEEALPYLKDKGHIVVFIKDLQPKGKNPNFLHAKMVEKFNEIPSLYYVGMKIWADQTCKLFPYGYPFGFVANQIHQYILFFQKKDRA